VFPGLSFGISPGIPTESDTSVTIGYPGLGADALAIRDDESVISLAPERRGQPTPGPSRFDDMSFDERMDFDAMCEETDLEEQVTTGFLDTASWQQDTASWQQRSAALERDYDRLPGYCSSEVTTAPMDPQLWNAQESASSILASFRRAADSGEVR